MRLRTARKIADRVSAWNSNHGPCPYHDDQLLAAYMRLHSAWIDRCPRTPVGVDGHFMIGATPDFFRANRVDSARYRAHYFRGGVFDGDRPRNASFDNLVRTTWKTAPRKSQI